jgi:adenosine deaminase
MLADCHLHFEGSLPIETVRALGGSAGNRLGSPGVFETERDRVRDKTGFLALYAEVCRLFRRPEDFLEAGRAVAESLHRDGLAYAEVYVSPEIYRKFGLPPGECLAAVAQAFGEEGSGRARCRILLDGVRHWGPESAHRVLDLHEARPLREVVGFGLGGDETACPASEFAGVYARARALGLRTSVHAGEWGGPQSVEEALDFLRPDRLDHGVAAARDERLVARLAEEGTVLCVALSSNRVTGAAEGGVDHPLRRLLAAGVPATLSADDPLLFDTTTRREYRIARDELGLDDDSLRLCARNAWRGAFCSEAERRRGEESARGLPV